MIIKVCFMSLPTTTTSKNPNTKSSRGEEISDLHGSARFGSGSARFFWFTVGKLCSVYTHSLLGCVVLFRLWQATWRDFSIKVCLLPFTKLRGPRWGTTTLSLTNSTLRRDIKTVQTTTTAATTGPNGFWFLSGQRVEGRKMLKGLS